MTFIIKACLSTICVNLCTNPCMSVVVSYYHGESPGSKHSKIHQWFLQHDFPGETRLGSENPEGMT
jgi:hypothetical protein